MSKRGKIVTGIVVVVVIALGVTIPSLLRARVTSGEAAPIGDTRTVISAQSAYQSANGGYFDGRLQCLNEPSNCIPGYASNQPTFLDPLLASLQPKLGYRRFFHPGPAPSPADIAKAKASPSSVLSYAYVAVPLKVGETGVRAYCGDSRGVVCSTMNGAMPKIEAGQCPLAACTVLQ